MLAKIIEASIRFRTMVLVVLALLLGGGAVAAVTLPIDAVPDLATVQVSVLTEAPGLSPIEIERTVTFPVEIALNGTPGLVELRSVSRNGLSSVTVIVKDGMDIWFLRQVILERLRTVEPILPKAAGRPELSPVSGGLGEIFQFVVRSEQHSPTQLRTILDWDVVPKLRSVAGVIEVNTMGGHLKQYQVVLDQGRMHAHGVSLHQVAEALQRANVSVGGGYLDRSSEALALIGVGLLRGVDDAANVVVRTEADGTPLLIKHLGEVRVGAALRYGVVTRNGEGEAVAGIVMMLTGSNSRTVVNAVGSKIREIQRELPPGVAIESAYDRANFVERTLTTVMKNLIEGALIVTVVLALLLGTFRGALVVVLGIPASMSVALFGMHLFGITGDLMSLGAIDFGFLVDGPIVILEAVMAATAGKKLVAAARGHAYGKVARTVSRPVAFAVAIIMLVYVPLLTLQGMEGKMFRPMALTMAAALLGALIYSVLFFPALLVAFVPPPSGSGPGWIGKLETLYERWLEPAIRLKWWIGAVSLAALAASLGLLIRGGADFMPRIEEGDMVVSIRRAPSINLTEAKELDLAAERVVKRFPEALSVLGLTGRAEVAVDPVGNDKTDLLVHLRPKTEWTTAKELDDLAEAVKSAIESEVPGSFVAISQPIEDRVNELVSGSRADVQIAVFGPDLAVLKTASEQIGAIVEHVRGTGDLRVERLVGAPSISVYPDRLRLARYGVGVEDALAVVEAARVGLPVGSIFEGNLRFDLRVLAPPRSATPEGLGQLFVEAAGGTMVPLSEIAKIEQSEGPPQVRRKSLMRTVRVEVNLRGRDLVSWVAEARENVEREVKLPTGYEIQWGGQFENFERARKRLGLVVPMALGIIFGMLYWMFQSSRHAAAVFAIVPFALVGGIMGLVLRGLPFSIPAAVGFIALAGVSVLNGVVVASDVERRLVSGAPLREAVTRGAAHSVRAVLTTTAAAAFGFLPMAISTGAGAEVQRPLATVVIAGIAFSMLLTMFLLPGILELLLRGRRPQHGDAVDMMTIPPPSSVAWAEVSTRTDDEK